MNFKNTIANFKPGSDIEKSVSPVIFRIKRRK